MYIYTIQGGSQNYVEDDSTEFNKFYSIQSNSTLIYFFAKSVRFKGVKGRHDKLLKDKLLKDKLLKDKLLKRQTPERQTPERQTPEKTNS